ncbi:hypothetical protein WJX77_005143 [Trebouxia sp. C0004]
MFYQHQEPVGSFSFKSVISLIATWKYLEAYCIRSSLAHLQSGLIHMSTPLENLEQQYAAEVVKVDADEGLLKRLERGIRGLKGVADSTGPAADGSVVLSQELLARLDTLPEDSQAVSHLFKQGRLPVPYGNLEALEDMTKELVVGSSGKLAEFFSSKIQNGGLLDATGKNEEATWSAFTSSLQMGRLQTAKSIWFKLCWHRNEVHKYLYLWNSFASLYGHSFEDVQAAYAVANQCSAMVSTAEARETPTLHGPVAKFRNDKDMVLQKEKYLKVVLSRLGWSRHPSSLTVEDVCKVIRACLQSASALHARQLVHRDFRYANVLWDSEGPFVIDLEMAATPPLKDPPEIVDEYAARRQQYDSIQSCQSAASDCEKWLLDKDVPVTKIVARAMS